ncbi:reverse transcriptase family protein [Methylocaldum sp.]|uniref:reverse transcriptase family protein n=1 Tax=Methylocaldum sp. TaxID=1969727 RepID=UPI002D2E16D7|nr:reverse transcriptase family protein [Methylocaldum sp.]HYE36065.1 reverse transcriptase family protein [Methylocaldum sp.]
MDKPQYFHLPIGSVQVLARTLGTHPDLLCDIARKVDQSYTSFDIPKKNGSFRTVVEPKHELKKLQKRINTRILEHVQYPLYLQGGIKDKNNPRDYIKNASIHGKPEIVITLDIKNFYTNIQREKVLKIFKLFFNFEPDVANLLTDLTTFNGRVPQGGCCSSYLANLVFFNSEYKLVQSLRRHGWRYSRLLDDITISSLTHVEDIESPIKDIAALCTKYGLKINNKKTKISYRKHGISDLCVTGVWIGHNQPRIQKEERRYIRLLTHICEQKYKEDPYSDDYHKLWNMVSGKVAKLARHNHANAQDYRGRLQDVFPLCDEHNKNSIIREVKTICGKPSQSHYRIGFIKKLNKAYYSLGILSRTDKKLSKSLRKEISEKHPQVPSIKKYWER